MNLIETRDLCKSYATTQAVDRISLAVPAGSVFGLIGSRGAGKTTLLRILATLVPPTSGTASILGISLAQDPTRIRRMVGYMPDSFGVYPDMTVTEFLNFFAACYGVSSTTRHSLVSDLLQLVDLFHHRDSVVESLSPGMKQRLGLARTLAHDPQVLLLDEPWVYLDPRAHVEISELIKELNSMGKGIIITSPGTADISDICTHMAIIDRGHLIVTGATSKLLDHRPVVRTISVKLFGNAEHALRIARTGRGIVDVMIVAAEEQEEKDAEVDLIANAPATTMTILKELRISFSGRYADATDLLRLFIHAGVQVVSFDEVYSSDLVSLITADSESPAPST